MASTTVTTIVMILFALGVFALTAYAWLGAWDHAATRPARVQDSDEIEVAVAQMRQAIEDYERSQR
jgi:cytochrome c-type biogenesis protein CcmH/NrfG